MRIINKLLLLLAVLIPSFFSISNVSANSASLYLSPSSGSYTVGNTFSIQAKVNSGGVAINAVDGTLVFDPDKLEAISVSKTDSVFSLWVQEPIFSNSLGTITFAGGKPSPGFTGAAGVIINMTFKARTAGVTNLTFASGSILADDGKGTNVLSNLGSGTYTLSGRTIAPLSPIAPPTEEYIPVSVPGKVPEAPIISSPSHPEEEKWYSNNAPEFTWKLPSDAAGVSLLLDKNEISNPGPISDGLTESKKFENVEDGIWYFHIKFRNQYGWGKITHRKVLIDTVPPLPFSIEIPREDPTEPQPFLLFETTDELSGIGYYELKIGQGEPFPAERIKTESYRLPSQAPGEHSIEVKAFDKAGNYTLSASEIEILAIESPIIGKIPKTVSPEESLIVEGKSLPDAAARIFVQKKGQEPKINEVKSDGEGNWSFTSPTISEKGEYLVWAQTQDKRGALSHPSEKHSFEVGLPPFLKIGKIAIDYLTTMITLIILIIGAGVVIFYAWYQISVWRKRLRTETKEVSQGVARAFRALREEVEEQIEFLDGKPGLNKDERKVRDKLKEALNISEEFIGKEIKDIERELE